MKRTPLKRSRKPLRRSKLKRVSSKQKGRMELYYSLRGNFLKLNPWCHMCIWKGKVVGRGANRATDVHHRRGRGKYLNAVSTFSALCRPCHTYIHEHGNWARENGWLISKFAKD